MEDRRRLSAEGEGGWGGGGRAHDVDAADDTVTRRVIAIGVRDGAGRDHRQRKSASDDLTAISTSVWLVAAGLRDERERRRGPAQWVERRARRRLRDRFGVEDRG